MEQAFFLRRGDTVALLEGAGSTVEVSGGNAWMTQFGDPNDYILANDRRNVTSDGSVLIYAFQECQVTLAAPASARVEVRRRGEVPVAIVERPTRRLFPLLGRLAVGGV
jgi:hypothetical protein